ncbi:hypothetical protein P3S68_015728 [Capsicum galapagoense]
MDYMVTFNPYTDEVKNNVLDGLKKDLQGVTILTSNGDNDDNGDLGGNPVRVRIGDDASPSTSKVIVDTSVNVDLHKCVAMLEKALLDIAAYIKEKRLKKKMTSNNMNECMWAFVDRREIEGEEKEQNR